MDKLKWVCSRYNVVNPEDLIGNAGQEPREEHLYVLGFKSLEHDKLTKLSRVKETVANIRDNNESETVFGRYIWLNEAKRHCEELFKLFYNSGLLGHALKNEKEFKEPVGFLNIRRYVLEKYHEYEKLYLKSVSNKPYWNLPDPESIAEKFVNRKENKSGKYKVPEIILVMSIAQKYIFEKRIIDIDRHVKPITELCKELSGSPNAKRTWVKYYAMESGLKVPGHGAK